MDWVGGGHGRKREFLPVVGSKYGVEAMQLVGNGGREDGLREVVVNRVWKVGELRWVGDVDVAETFCECVLAICRRWDMQDDVSVPGTMSSHAC